MDKKSDNDRARPVIEWEIDRRPKNARSKEWVRSEIFIPNDKGMSIFGD